MGLFDFLKQHLGGLPERPAVLSRSWSDEGVRIRFAEPLAEPSVEAMLAASDMASPAETFLAAYLAQLIGEEHARLDTLGVTVPWHEVYSLGRNQEHAVALQALGLPVVRLVHPILSSKDTLAEKTFEVLIDGWAENDREVQLEALAGAVYKLDDRELLLPEAAWQVVNAVRRFAARVPAQRSQHENELAWGRIRSFADAAGALYRTPYLETTYVLTPETLRLPLSRDETPFGRVLTVEPTFERAPAGWLKAFDGFNSVQPHYDFMPRDGGHVRVVVSEPVRKVLSVIKREMPNRKVAGARAERFVHNPWAFLGEAAHEVLREEQFSEDKAGAGAIAAGFTITPRTRESRIERVDLVVTEHFFGGSASTSTKAFAGPEPLQHFIASLEQALQQERSQFPWEEYDLNIDGDSVTQLEYARQLLHLWQTQPETTISFEDIYELEGYSGRIEGIGVAKPIYVPLIQKPSSKEEGKPGWMPSELTPMVNVTLAGHDGQVVIPLSTEWVGEFEKQVENAEHSGAKEVRNASLPTSIATPQARTLLDGFRSMLDIQAEVKSDGVGASKKERSKKESLLVKLNFSRVDYAEQRRLSLALPSASQAELPRCLRSSIKLKKHQLDGVAWMQHLVSRAPGDCRGALVADDMGLGKTLQLLVLLGWYYEKSPNAAPSIILAPKSLIENWAAEIKKFFTEGFPELLVLYGDTLRARKQPLGLIDQQLQDRGVTDLLKPSWAGNAKVIISTYDVLTSYEFSVARQPFAFVICDEAQRIKTPGTQATLAAKALKADFRIACTGTPVENSLADLWCLFDLVQPGLLGGLEEFGRTYRRPIECKTEEQLAALAKLQQAIAPQTLRRTKLDISNELKKKYFATRAVSESEIQFREKLKDNERLEVPMSTHQNMLYLGGLKRLQDANQESDGRKRARLSFGALHLMKAVCAEPYCLPGMKFLPDRGGRETHLQNSPKLAWLLQRLREIRSIGEKAILFTELREVQAALYYFMREEFNLRPHIINGDSQNRQNSIDRFSRTEGFDVIILSTLAAGAGLNVTAANHVFHFTRAWNPAKENQATDRAYRIGQEKDVYVYCPVTVADGFVTFDVRLDELLREKEGLADTTIGGSAMESMLNGAARDVSFAEMVGIGGDGVAIEKRFLTLDDVDRMDGFRFEVLCMLLWAKSGYATQLTNKRGGDAGVDVIAINGREGELLQCKSSSAHDIGWDAIKEVHTGAARYQAQFPGTLFRRLAVTNQRFTSGAKERAEEVKVGLIERHQLEELLARHPVHNHEFEDAVADSVPFLYAA